MERYQEAKERPKAFDKLGKLIQQYMKIVEAYKTKVIRCAVVENIDLSALVAKNI